MKFPQLYIRNFLTIEKAELFLADAGLILIQGENQDDSSAVSNGAGKSSIVDALCWCLYGVTARGKSGDGVVNNARKKDCAVMLEVQDGTTRYRIERFRKHHLHKNALKLLVAGATPGDAPLDLTKGTDKETQDLLEKIIGCSYEVFRAAVYSGQEDMPDLPGMTDKQLKLLIEEAAGIERIEKAYELSRAMHKDASTELTVVTNRLASAREAADQSEGRIAVLKIDHARWEKERSAKLVDLRSQMADVGEKFKTAHAAFTALGEEALKKELTDCTAAIAAFNESTMVRAEHVKNLMALERTEANWMFAAQGIKTKIDNAKNAVAHAIDGVCGACGQRHTKEKIDAIIAEQAEQLARFTKELKEAIAQRDATRESIVKTREAIDAIDAQPRPEASLKRIEAINLTLREVESQKRNLHLLKADFAKAKFDLERVTGEANPYVALLEKEDERIKQHRDEIERIEKLQVAWSNRVSVLVDAVKVFGPAGVRAHLLDTVTPFLNERTAEYLSVLSDGNMTATWTTLVRTKAGELKEKFTIEVTHAKGGDDYAAISGGEKRKVRIATVLALQDLVAGRATKPIDLWVGDEIDDALDPAGLERLMVILERRARERGTVLIVSHADLKDWIDRVVTVTKEAGGLSKVEGAICP